MTNPTMALADLAEKGAVSAVRPHDGVMHSVVWPWRNAETMSLFLSEVAQRHAVKFVAMVMGQAGRHLVGALTVPASMRLIDLPPYSPESTLPSTCGKPVRVLHAG